MSGPICKNYVQPNERFERTYVLWIVKNYSTRVCWYMKWYITSEARISYPASPKALWFANLPLKVFSIIPTVPFKSKLTVCCESRFLTRSSIPARIEYREPFIENREPVIHNREILIENRVWKQRFSHDWFLDFTLSDQSEPQAATPVLRVASQWKKSKLIGEKCVLKYFL